MATTQAFCLRRSNHLSDMVDDLSEMFKDESMVDVTLSCEDGLIKAHRIILSVCSSYFKTIFSRVNHSPLQYPIIIIQHMPFQDLKYIMEFMYNGEVTVPQEHLSSVLKSAELLKVKGLADLNGQANKTDASSGEAHTTAGRRKRQRKRRKASTDKKSPPDKHVTNSSVEEASEYSDEDDLSPSSNGTHHANLDNDDVLHSAAASGQHTGTVNETEIEPSRLLEQSMITGTDSLTTQANQKYPPYLISSVKQMMYDDSSGLIANQLANDSNHNLALTPYDESSSLVGPSSITLLPRQGEDHAFNGGGAPNLSSAAQLMSGDGSSTGQSTVGLNSATGLLPMQIPALTSLTAAASLPAMGAPNLRPSSLSFNFDSLSSKRHYSCPVCYKTFSEKGNMKRHTAIHEQIRPRYVCDSCGKCFVWKDNHARHLRLSHPN